MIRVENITKSYGEKRILENINFTLEAGELLFIKGRSGSGKSTLLNIICALLESDSGEVWLDDTRICGLSNYLKCEIRNKEFGLIFQSPTLIPDLSVDSNIALPLLRQKLPLNAIEARVRTCASIFKIEHKLGAKASILSGGEAQRVSAARALACNPKVILADEPTANLDGGLTRHFIEILKEFKAEGKIVIVATHDTTLLESGIQDTLLDFDTEAL